jgi:CheY-like chemotaxis protein
MGRAILLVDDDPAICEALMEILEDEGYEVTVARNGREALDYLRKRRDRPPGLILLDLMMPVMSGVEFLDAYGEEPGLPSVPVVVLSVNPALSGRQHRRDVLLYLSKPVKLPHLLGTVEQWCA